jgi:hypothetical protein
MAAKAFNRAQIPTIINRMCTYRPPFVHIGPQSLQASHRQKVNHRNDTSAPKYRLVLLFGFTLSYILSRKTAGPVIITKAPAMSQTRLCGIMTHPLTLESCNSKIETFGKRNGNQACLTFLYPVCLLLDGFVTQKSPCYFKKS